MARPRKIELRRGFLVKLLPEEKARIEVLADHAGLTMSEFLRRCALGKRIHSKVSMKAMGELGRLGGLQKYCLQQIKDQPDLPETRHQLNAVLNAILAEIKRVQADEREA
ncbi:MAG TPA: hypothetical protein VGB94_09950 [Acidobacteriaceae bacterium]